jgi:hypothetical protein
MDQIYKKILLLIYYLKDSRQAIDWVLCCCGQFVVSSHGSQIQHAAPAQNIN